VRFAALVRGPSPVLPRGSLWIIPIWYVVVAGLIEYFGRFPRWYSLVALAGLAAALVIQLAVLATMRSNAFVADADGIILGLRGGARRRLGRRRRQNLALPWAQIERLGVIPRHYGARLDIVLGPAAPLQRRPGRAVAATLTLVTLLLPVCCLFRAPGLVTPRASGPDYRLRLCDVSAGPLRSVLAAMAGPAGVPVTLAARRRPFAGHRGQIPAAARPATLGR
jgi:hypothetical protein